MRVIVVAVAIGIASARAAAAPVSLPPLLSWAAPAGCGDELHIRALIAQRAHRTGSAGAPFAIVEVQREGDGFVAKLQIRSDQGVEQREVRGATCEKVADAVAWVLALAWSPPPPPPPPPRIERAAPRTARRHVPLPLHPFVVAHAGYDAGTLPDGSVGAGLGLGVAYARALSLELGGTWWARRFEPLMPGAPAGIDVGLAALDARLCALPVPVCAGLELGQLGGTGVELGDAHAAQLRWLAATLGVRWHRPAARGVALVLETDVVVPLGRPQFELDDGTAVFRPPVASVRFDLGVEFAPSW